MWLGVKIEKPWDTWWWGGGRAGREEKGSAVSPQSVSQSVCTWQPGGGGAARTAELQESEQNHVARWEWSTGQIKYHEC